MIKIKKTFSKLLKRYSSYCDVKFWPLEGDFSPAFYTIGCQMNTRAAEYMKIGTRFFRSGNPFLKSKIPKNESFRV